MENGTLTAAREMNVTGNMIDLWNKLVETGNDHTTAAHAPPLVSRSISWVVTKTGDFT